VTEKCVSLVLGSGTARGLAHIGVLKVWEREQLPLDLIVGASIGALVGGVYACGRTALEMEETALSLDVMRLAFLADLRIPNTAILKGRRVERFIQGLVDGKSFADTRVPFACVATDLAGRREVVLREGDLASAIMASISAPVIFPPTQREGSSLVDGAVLNPVPVDVARDLGADLVVAVTTLGNRAAFRALSPVDADKEESCESGRSNSTIRGHLRRPWPIRRRQGRPFVSHTMFGSISLMQRGLSEPRLQTANLVIAPEINGVRLYSFHDAARIVAMGERAAEQALGDVERLLSSRLS
jgi:NTE family protein